MSLLLVLVLFQCGFIDHHCVCPHMSCHEVNINSAILQQQRQRQRQCPQLRKNPRQPHCGKAAAVAEADAVAAVAPIIDYCTP